MLRTAKKKVLQFEMENVAPLSAVYNETDHLFSRQGIPLSVGGHRFLDMRDEWCVNYLDEKVIKLLDESGYGYTSIIECTAEDYNDPTGYQIVLRELGDNALMIVHTFKDGANPPVEKYLADWKITKTFGSDLDGDFRGKAYLIER